MNNIIKVSDTQNKIIVNQTDNTVKVVQSSNKIIVRSEGIQGAKGDSSSQVSVSFTDQTSVTVTHNLGRKPIVQVLGNGGNVITVAVEHINTSSFIVTSNTITSGEILYYN